MNNLKGKKKKLFWGCCTYQVLQSQIHGEGKCKKALQNLFKIWKYPGAATETDLTLVSTRHGQKDKKP